MIHNLFICLFVILIINQGISIKCRAATASTGNKADIYQDLSWEYLACDTVLVGHLVDIFMVF